MFGLPGGGDAAPLAQTFVQIKPDTSGFPEELQAKVRAATSIVDGKVKITGDVSGLARQIDEVRAKALLLRTELARDPGNSGLKKAVADVNTELRALEQNRRAIDQTIRDLAKVPDSLGLDAPGLIGKIGFGLAAASPFITSTIGGAIIGGVGAAGIAGGIALAIKDPRVKAAGVDLGRDLSADLSAAARPFSDAVLAEIPRIRSAVGELRPELSSIFSALAPDVDVLGGGLIAGLQNALPGVLTMIQAGQPLMQTFAAGLAKGGTDLAQFFDKIASGEPGAQAALTDLGHGIEDVVGFTGSLIQGGEKVYGTLDTLGLPIKGIGEGVLGLVVAYKAAKFAQDAWITAKTVATGVLNKFYALTGVTSSAMRGEAVAVAEAARAQAALAASEAGVELAAARETVRTAATVDAVNALAAASERAAAAQDGLAAAEARVAEAKAAGPLSGVGTGTIAGALALAGFGIAQGAGSVFGHDDTPKNIPGLAGNLAQWGTSGRSDDPTLGHLNYDLGTIGSSPWDKIRNKTTGFLESLTGASDLFDQTEKQAKARLGGIDQAMASLVQNGHGDEAAAAFGRLQGQAQKAGISLDDLKAGLPQYEAAVTASGTATDKTAGAMTNAADAAGHYADDAKLIVANLGNLTAAGQGAQSILQAFWAAHADLAENSIKSTAAASVGLGQLADTFKAEDQAVRDAVQAQTDTARQGQQAVHDAEQSQRDTYISGQRSVRSAVEAVSNAQRNRVQAERDVTAAMKEATQQLADYRRAVRDIADNEEEARIRLERAKAQVLQTSGLPTSNIDRREAVVQLDEAQHNLDDVLAASAKTRRDAAAAEAAGVQGAAPVVAARQRVTDAVRSERDAHQSLTDAQRKQAEADQKAVQALAETRRRAAEENHKAAKTVTDAQAADSRSLDVNTAAGGKNVGMILGQIDTLKKKYSDDVAHANGNHALEEKAQQDFDAGIKKLEDQAARYGLNRQAVDELAQATTDYQNMSPVDVLFKLDGAADATSKIQNLFGQVKDFASLFGVTLGQDDGWTSADDQREISRAGTVPAGRSPSRSSNPATAPGYRPVASRAAGGPIHGDGTGMSDQVPILASHDEHMWTAQETAAVGGHGAVKALRNMALGKYATGGPIVPGLAINDNFSSQVNKLTGPAFAAVANAIASAAAESTGGAYTGPKTKGNSINEILRVANLSGIGHTVTAESYDTPGFYHSDDGGYHSRHEAVDFGNWQYGQGANDRFAQWWAANYAHKLLELIHTRADGSGGWYVKNGAVVGPGYYGASTVRQHVDHVHVAAAPGFSAGGGSNGVGTGAVGGSTAGAGIFSAILGRIAATGSLSGASPADVNVAQVAFQTARGMGADRKVMMALFEAGLVESNMRNLNYGDRDSLGYLQQRPSMGWPSPTNVPIATRSFVSRAMANEGRYGSPGQLAQSVQRSAYPARYDARAGDAAGLLARISGGVFDSGGKLPHGTAAVNLSGRTEAVLDPDESAGLKAAVRQGPVELSDRTIRQLGMVMVAALNGRDNVVAVDGREIARTVADAQARELAGFGALA